MNNQTSTPTVPSGGRKHKNDMIFIAALLVAVTLLGAIWYFCRGEGDTVTVTVDGVLFGEYSLSVDRTVEIRTDKGLNVLVIEDGRARVVEASCPDGICAAHRPISRSGESIACLPNKVIVTVKATDPNAPDVIA